MYKVNQMFGLTNQDGTVSVFNNDGSVATRIDANVYPLGSHLCAKWEHPAGIALTMDDCAAIGLHIDY